MGEDRDIDGEQSREQGGPRAGATWGMLSAMNTSEFRRHAHAVVDWMADYVDQVEAYPVRAQVKPGEIAARLPASPPERGESMDRIFAEFQSVLLPGITHWQLGKLPVRKPRGSMGRQ